MSATGAAALERAAATNDDILALVDRAIMYIARDEPDARTLDRRLSILNDIAPVALLGSGAAVHLPRPARALATFIDRATYDEDDWLWARRTLTALQLDPGALLVATREAMASGQTDRVRVLLPRADYLFFPVDGLPFGHNPYKCGHIEEHRVLESEARRAHRRTLVRRLLRGRAESSVDPALAAGRRLNDLLLAGRLPTCDMHDLTVDWVEAMAEARRVLDTADPWTPAGIDAALGITSDEDSSTMQRFIRDLFTDAVRWDGRRPYLNNGQHRVCGARIARLPELLIAMPRDERSTQFS